MTDVDRERADAQPYEIEAMARTMKLHGAFAEVVRQALLDGIAIGRALSASDSAQEISHDYMGGCPDAINGMAARDPKCPACARLLSNASDSAQVRRRDAVIDAAIAWWENHRPVAWDEAMHAQHPAVNMPRPSEEALAVAVSRYREVGRG